MCVSCLSFVLVEWWGSARVCRRRSPVSVWHEWPLYHSLFISTYSAVAPFVGGTLPRLLVTRRPRHFAASPRNQNSKRSSSVLSPRAFVTDVSGYSMSGCPDDLWPFLVFISQHARVSNCNQNQRVLRSAWNFCVLWLRRAEIKQLLSKPTLSPPTGPLDHQRTCCLALLNQNEWMSLWNSWPATLAFSSGSLSLTPHWYFDKMHFHMRCLDAAPRKNLSSAPTSWLIGRKTNRTNWEIPRT